MLVSNNLAHERILIDGGDVYWVETRPSERGRSVVVRRTGAGETGDVTPPGFNARTRVHEYGGGAYTVEQGAVYFSNFADQRLYRQTPGAGPEPLTPAGDCALCRLRHRPAAATDDLRSGGPHRQPARGRQHTGLHSSRRRTRPAARCGRRLLRNAAPAPGWRPTGVARLEPPEHAVGRYRVVDGRDSTQRDGSANAERSPAAGRNRSSSRPGRRTACSISYPTDPAGGTSTDGMPGAPSRSVKWKPSSGCRNGAWA